MPMRTLTLRLYPTQDQAEALGTSLGLCRRLYNLCLEHRQRLWKYHAASISLSDQQAQLVDLKKAFPEFKSVSAQVLQDVTKRLDRAYQNFFDGRASHPRFKGRAAYRSMTFPQSMDTGSGSFRYRDGRLRLSKIGWVRALHEDKPPWLTRDAIAKTCTVKEDRFGEWWAYITFDVPEDAVKREPAPVQAVGLDMGLTNLVTLSDGTTIENPKHLARSQEKLRREQRRLARKKQGSKNRAKQRKRVAKLHRRIKRQRLDALHKAARTIAKSHSVVAVEDNLAGLARSDLARSVNDAAWGTFVRLLEYKCTEHGSTLVKVDPAHTSQDCSECGSRVPKSLWDRVHECPDCGVSLNRDVNAARNILQRGLAKLGKAQYPRAVGNQRPRRWEVAAT